MAKQLEPFAGDSVDLLSAYNLVAAENRRLPAPIYLWIRDNDDADEGGHPGMDIALRPNRHLELVEDLRDPDARAVLLHEHGGHLAVELFAYARQRKA